MIFPTEFGLGEHLEQAIADFLATSKQEGKSLLSGTHLSRPCFKSF